MAWEPPEVTAANNSDSRWEPPEVAASRQQDSSSTLPQGPDMSPIQPQGSNPVSMALSAAGQTFGMQPTSASTPIGTVAQTVKNQVLAPAKLSNTMGAASPGASQAAENLLGNAGVNPILTKAAGLIAGAAVDPRSYVMPGGDVSIAPENLPGAKVGEMLSGTRASNLNRAYQGGFYKTYIAPQSMAKSSQEFGDALSKTVTSKLSPEEQAAMLINPRGEANAKIADVYAKWIAGQPISAQDAVSAKVAVNTVFPNATAKNASKIAKLTDFERSLNGIIASDPSPEAQAFSQANSNYAASKLRSDLLKPLPVNKSNPNEFSKLARYLPEVLGVGGGMTGHGIAGAVGATGALMATSPLALGIGSSLAGSAGNLANKVVSNPMAQALIAKYLEHLSQNNGPTQHQGISQ